MRITAILILLLAALLPVTTLADADEREQKEQQLEQIRGKISSLLKKIEKEQSQKSGVERQLRDVEKRLGKLRREIRQLNQEIASNTRELKQLQKQQGELRQALRKQRQLLQEQLKAAYMSGNREQLKLILNQEDPEALSRIATYYDYVNRARAAQIRETQTTMRELRQVETRIETSNEQLYALSQQHERQRHNLNQNRQERKRVLDQIRAQLKQEGRQLATLRSNEKEIEALLVSLSNLLADIPDMPSARVPFSSLRGKLSWPTQGSLRNRFGASRNTGDLKWHGLLLKAPAGRQVKAVASGRVAFADWFQGFGLIVIIDHDDGYLSLYGHNQALFTETGDWVERGQVIANVGDSGGLEEASLYFELRHQGKPVDPTKWLSKRAG